MSRALVRWLLRAYPASWRARYGEELEALLQAGSGGPRTILDVLRSALRERWSPSLRPETPMTADPRSFLALSGQPGALLPMAMSVAALTVVAISLARFGVPPPHADEGAAAHLWQLLMGLQLPWVAWFAVKWMRTTPRATLGVLGIQVALALAAIAPVYLLGL